MKKMFLAVCIVFALSVAQVGAAPISSSFTGSFNTDDDVEFFSFAVTEPSLVTLRTWSYAGGTNAEGNTISAGGFDPIITLFNGTGNLIDDNDDGAGVAADPVTGAEFDAVLSIFLDIGNYTASLTQYANFAIGPNLADGFTGSGVTGFIDADGNTRTSAWAFDIVISELPEPTSVALLGLGLVSLAFTRRSIKKIS
ncbi:MAG: PEP-CTERM sorting domain-containing protein [Nitrosomonas sp.]|nr:MAG: PEP-CTERM sorting domain-containing protein [Nitrosomonas sp.]HMU63911.1 DVUA0089 family protein [Nitrosomonas sp.]HMV11564.1 DVUA0089 family protein [Nitrosomonas sp.]HMW19914.1 DVUA0089 family protein [Nitrosomonas sp.]HMW68954.1 DVUA0089 family protein [Nitrosomonas sp.]